MGFDPRQRRADAMHETARPTTPQHPKETHTMATQPDGYVPGAGYAPEDETSTSVEGMHTQIDTSDMEVANVEIRAQKMDFLRSTTTTTVDTTAIGETKVSVRHVARFAIEPGFVEDLVHHHGVQNFRPEWLEATWRDGVLVHARTTGPRVLKSGKTQKKSVHASLDQSREKQWGYQSDTRPVNRGALPHNIERRIADYELALAYISTGATMEFNGDTAGKQYVGNDYNA